MGTVKKENEKSEGVKMNENVKEKQDSEITEIEKILEESSKNQVIQNKYVSKTDTVISQIFKDLNSISLITHQDAQVLEKAHNFLISTYTDVPLYRSYVDKCVGVLTNSRFPTPDAKYWQCKKEAEVQFYELLKEICNYKKILIDIKELLYKKKKLKDQLSSKIVEKDEFFILCDLERIDVAMMELNFLLKKTEKEIKFRIVEIEDWLEISEEWKPEMKYSSEYYEHHQIESLIQWLSYQIDEAKAKNDNETLMVLLDQMDTMKSLLKRKFQQIVKENPSN